MSEQIDFSRLSLNTATVKQLSLPEAVSLTASAGLSWIGLWRDRVAETGLKQSQQLVADAGLSVSSLCRGGFLSASAEDRIADALDDNRRALEEAAELGCKELIMVVGGLFSFAGAVAGQASADNCPRIEQEQKNLVAARERVADRIAELAEEARDYGVRLALEPLHPVYVADRAVLSTLGQALDLAEQFDPAVVGVVVDSFHVFWDPALQEQILRAGRSGRISSYQISDFSLPLAADALLSRAFPGDGYVDFAALSSYVSAAGYRGPIEVEIFNQKVWDSAAPSVLARVKTDYAKLVLPFL